MDVVKLMDEHAEIIIKALQRRIEKELHYWYGSPTVKPKYIPKTNQD